MKLGGRGGFYKFIERKDMLKGVETRRSKLIANGSTGIVQARLFKIITHEAHIKSYFM